MIHSIGQGRRHMRSQHAPGREGLRTGLFILSSPGSSWSPHTHLGVANALLTPELKRAQAFAPMKRTMARTIKPGAITAAARLMCPLFISLTTPPSAPTSTSKDFPFSSRMCYQIHMASLELQEPGERLYAALSSLFGCCCRSLHGFCP